MERKNIWVAASDGDLQRVKELIEAGLSPTVADENSYTPIHAAASWGRAEILRYLTSQGGDINVTDDDGDTPLFSVEDVETAKLVIELGGDPRHKNEEGKTAAESMAEEYPEVSNYLRRLTGEPLLEEESSNLSENDDQMNSEQDPTNEMTKVLIDQVREMMTDAKAQGIDTNSPELDSRLRELVTKTVDQTVDLGRFIASNTTTATSHSPSDTTNTNHLETLNPVDETNQLTTTDNNDLNKRQKT